MCTLWHAGSGDSIVPLRSRPAANDYSQTFPIYDSLNLFSIQPSSIYASYFALTAREEIRICIYVFSTAQKNYRRTEIFKYPM